jgi:hypothetical protein
MEKGKPFRVRKAAYAIILAARDGWLKSTESRQILENLDFPRELHSVVVETGHSDDQRLLLTTMEILSEDSSWHSYLRRSMDIWLPFRHEGLDQVLRTFTRVVRPPRPNGSNPPPLPSPFDGSLGKLVEDEWARVPGYSPMDLTTGRLNPLVEVTMGYNEFFTENERRAVLAKVEQVIPSLERRRDDGYEGPDEELRGVIGALLEILRVPMASTSR